MLEGVVARLLNRWLGKYVLDLDTENLNVGIFSGQVQLTELRLKPEALYELDLPIEIKFGTIGAISIQIPWNALLNQPVIIKIEDVHILSGPVVTNSPFDSENEKRLTRAAKKKTLSDLYTDGDLIGGPNLFPEYLITSIINNFQVIIHNVHIRYEDNVSTPSKPIAAGICISSITAETTNNKWKASNTPRGCSTGYHLLKIESFSVYWNHICELQTWDWKSQYYLWRNLMTHSLQTFSMNDKEFDFLIKPMTCKVKFIINKSNGNQALKLLIDMVLQDFTIQISREQYLSINAALESLTRMRTSRQFLQLRPTDSKVTKSTASAWWRYAFEALLEQRIRPYTWSKIAKVRANYRLYRDAYKKVLVNPNDTELKLDLQKYEDNLSLINIVIAREHARIMLEQEIPDYEGSPLERGKSFWSMLPSPEKNHLCQMIGYLDNFNDITSTAGQYVDHKYNITISNFSLSFLHDNKEVLVTTLTQVLASAETRSTGNFAGWNKFLKFSARAEGFVIEGASVEDHLVPLISAQHHCSNGGSMTPNVFSMDYETNQAGSEATCKLWCSLEAIEITFHTHAVAEILKFFDSSPLHIPNIKEYKDVFLEKLKKLLCYILNKRVDLNLDIKIPYIIIPEYGTITKSGNILIIDFGRMVIRTELTQLAENLEEATQMELEECAYSRVHVDLFHAQVLFCDSSENWRDSRKETDTDMHLISKINMLVVFALCAKPDHKTLPKYKLNITIPSLKTNISERKIGLFLTYIEHLEQILTLHYEKFSPKTSTDLQWLSDFVVTTWHVPQLLRVRKSVSEFSVGKKHTLRIGITEMRRASDLSAITDRSAEPSDYSEESVEAWARCVDLPGLEDNVSPHNTIQNLVRIVLGELCLVLSRSSERIDRPYLMLRVGKCCLDLAIMDYGPALQLTVTSISLTDKLHTNVTGQYLDLIHVPAPADQDFLMLLYRKVRADCPDFRSHFHSVEKSLVADFGPVNFLIHRDAIRALVKYAQYLYNKVKKHKSYFITLIYKSSISLCQHLLRPSGVDPPVPPGAVKFSNSIRFTQITTRLCDADCDLLEIRISGLECDFMFRANERLVLRSYLGSLQVDHLTDVTLYTKVLTSDEEKVFEVKYVRHAPRLYTSNAGDISRVDDVNSDGSVRVYVGRLQITLLYKLILQLNHFFKPLVRTRGQRFVSSWLKGTLKNILHTNAKIHLAITIHGPTLLLPQKTASPNLMVIHTGELTVENFFKETNHTNLIIENILLKLEGTTILRAVMTLASSLEMQEAILEPMSLRFDVKRIVGSTGGSVCNTTRPPSWEIDGIMDVIKITLGQRDLTTLLAVYTDNINEGHFVEFSPDSGSSPIEMGSFSPPPNFDDKAVKSLEAFFCQVETKCKDICVKLNIEGILLSLFCDCEEVLSSPVRDLNHGLCRLEIGDTTFSADLFTDTSLEAKLSIQSVTIIDIRPDMNSINNTIFQSHRDETKANTYQISVSTPPVIDISFHQNNMGDKFIDIIVERVCLTVSVPFLATLGRFVFESMPCDRRLEGGIINHGYDGDATANDEEKINNEDQEIFDLKETPGLTIAVRMCKPEIVFLADAQIEKGNAFVLKAEILVDYSRHAMRENLMISLSNFHILFNAQRVSEPYILLDSCDLEFSKTFKIEDGIKSTLTVSSLQIHCSSGVFITITDILEDIYCHLNPPTEIKPKQFLPYINRSQEKCDELEDLWSPKRLSQCYVTEPEVNGSNVENLMEINRMFIGSISSVTIVLELEAAVYAMPVVLLQASLETTIHDWTRQLHGTVEIHLQANYFNEQVECWEPLIEPISCAESVYRPWECCIKIFQSSATPVNENCPPQQRSNTSRGTVRSNSSSGDEDTSSDGGMSFLRPQNTDAGDKATPRLTTSLAAFLEDSDSETEDGTMEKLASAICDLFTGDWNESEDSDCGHSSGTEESGGSESDSKRKTRSGSTCLTTDQLSTFILIDSHDILNITLTSQAIKLFYDIVISYTDRTVQTVSCITGRTITLVNDIGPKSKVELLKKAEDDSNENVVLCSKTFEKVDSGHSSPAKSVEDLSAEESVNSICSETRLRTTDSDWHQDKDMLQSLQFPELNTTAVYKLINDEQLCVEVPGFSSLYTSCPKRTWQKLLRLQPMLHNTKYYLVAKHEIDRFGRSLVVGSPLQICNETCYPIGILYEKSVLADMGLDPVGEIMNPFEGTIRVAVLEPQDIYNVPLHIAYHCKLFLQPAYVESHLVSSTGLWWPDLAIDLNSARDIYCEPKNPENDSAVFSLRIRMEERDSSENLSRQQSKTIPNYLIRLLPPLIIHNCLPYSVEIKMPQFNQQIHVDAGDKSTIYSLNIQRTVKFLIELNYLGLLWTASLNLTSDLDEKVLSMVTDFDTEGGNKQLSINVRVDRLNSCELFVYSPYWIVNKTGLPLQIRGCVSNMVYDSHGEETLLFSYKRQAKPSVRIRAYQSSWSAEFSLDAVGTTGLVIARDKERNRRYPILLTITLSNMSPRFTKIVTLLPNFLVHNNTKRYLRFMEENERTDLWLDLAPGQCVPFWPETQSMQMYVKYRDSKVVSQNFCIAKVHQTVLRMDKGSAVSVEVSGGRTQPFCITFVGYRAGDAPCRVDNMCSDLHLKVNQRDQGQVTLISPQHSLLYTWDDPCAERSLVWNIYNNKGVGFPLDIHTDGYGEVRIRLHTVKPGSVVPSPPAVQTSSVVANASSSSDSDSSSEEQQHNAQLTKKNMRRDKVVVYWLCYMDGPQRTVMFTQDHRLASQYRRRVHFDYCDWEICLSLSGIGISLCLSQPVPLEFAYISCTDSPALWEVNIAHKWKMLTLELASWVEDKYKTQQKKCQLKDYVFIDFEKMYMLKPFYGELRRTYYPALWLQYRRSESHQFYRLKLNSLQIESEPHANPQLKILYPLISGSAKPFGIPCVEFLCFKRHCALHEYDIYKYVSLEVQEFFVNIDRLLVERLHQIFDVWIVPNEPGFNIRSDMALVHVPLTTLVQQCCSNNKRAIIERLRLSPINLQISISPKSLCKRNIEICDLLRYIFNCLDMTYLSVKQAKYTLNSFELENISTNMDHLYLEIWNHFKTQLLQQFHVHVLGQEVLLNPYGYTLATQNFATTENDLSQLGVEVERTCRCMLGHVHGSQSLLTAILGRDYPFNHTLDCEYRRRRKYGPPHITSFPETLANVSRAFLVGVTLGFSGLFPNASIGNAANQYNGVEGFFRGSGKALASLMTRGGVSDCIDVATDAIRRAALMGERINVRQRLHRHIQPRMSLKPFSLYEAMGQNLLMIISNGRYAETDTYWAHAVLNNTGKLLLLITLQHIFLVENCRQWGPWDIEWSVDLDDVVSVPKVVSQEIVINIRQDDPKQQNSIDKYVVRGDTDILTWLKEKIEQALVISMEDKCWTTLEH